MLTKSAELELLKVINGYNNNDKSSTILPDPKFRRKTTTTFITDINTKLGVTDTKIIGLHHRKDVVVIAANYSGDTKGVLAYYNPQFDIYEILSQFNTGKVDTDNSDIYEDLYPFKETKLNRENFLYGLNIVNGKVNFFLTSDLMTAVGILSEDEFREEAFYSALFDIETEITEDPDSTTTPKADLKVKVGNGLFTNYEKIGFNQDAFNNDLYSFVLWKDNGQDNVKNEVQHVKFTAELSQQEAITSDWQINEAVGVSSGTQGTGIDFKGLSTIGVLSGEETLDNGETSLGSIIFSTQVDSGASQTINNKPIITTSLTPSFNSKIVGYDKNYNGVITLDTPIPNDKMQELLKPFFDILDNKTNTVNDFNGNFTIVSKYSGGSGFTIPLSKDFLTKMYNATTIELKWRADSTGQGPSGEYIEVLELYLKIDTEEFSIDKTDLQKSPFFEKSINVSKIYQDQRIAGSGTFYYSSFDFKSIINVDYDSVQTSTEANTTSQIVVGNDSNGQTYRTAVSEINSYEGTDPVFISPRKAFQPIKSKTTNQYAIYEFDGVIGTTEVKTFWNDVATKDYTTTDNYKKVLVEPQSINSVTLSGGTPLPTTDYSLDTTTGELTIKVAIASNVPIVVDYQTLVGVPRQVNLTTTTQGSDLYITGAADDGELSNTGISIVGAGDNSLKGVDPTRVFGFNLYRSKPNIDYDELAEEFEDLDFKVRHVKAYRQKDILYIFAYNEDYTEVVEWVQIYPDSFKPYTYLPYANPDEYFAVERFNQNTQRDLATSIFDREFLDIGTAGNVLLATTTAGNTDMNDPKNDTSEIFGHTNEPLFTFTGQIIKQRNEIRSLQFTLNASMIDRLQDKEEYSQSQGELLIDLFGNKNQDAHNLIALDEATITYVDGTKIARQTTDFTTVNEVDSKLEFGMAIVDKTGNSDLESLTITNKNGDVIINIDLTQHKCIGGVRNINFDIVITDNKEGVKYNYAKGGN